MADQPRMTPPMLALLNVFIQRPSGWRYGLELIDALGIKGGTVYPALARLERFGWLESRPETMDPSELGRPRRKMYRLTGEGEERAGAALDRWRRLFGLELDVPPSSLNWGSE